MAPSAKATSRTPGAISRPGCRSGGGLARTGAGVVPPDAGGGDATAAGGLDDVSRAVEGVGDAVCGDAWAPADGEAAASVVAGVAATDGLAGSGFASPVGTAGAGSARAGSRA